MNILAIGAHPDDLEFGCGGILIKEIKKGSRVKLLVLSRGEAGSSGTPEARARESRRSAEQMGAAGIKFLDFGGDCYLQYLPDNALGIASEIREFQPSIVLAPHPLENQHPDHSVAGRLVRDACRFARYGGLDALRSLEPHKIDNLFFYHITQHLHRPDLVVDITSVVKEWEAAMRCHESQITNMNYIDLQTAGARLLGLTIGTEYAAGLFTNDPVRLDSISDLNLSARQF